MVAREVELKVGGLRAYPEVVEEARLLFLELELVLLMVTVRGAGGGTLPCGSDGRRLLQLSVIESDSRFFMLKAFASEDIGEGPGDRGDAVSESDEGGGGGGGFVCVRFFQATGAGLDGGLMVGE